MGLPRRLALPLRQARLVRVRVVELGERADLARCGIEVGRHAVAQGLDLARRPYGGTRASLETGAGQFVLEGAERLVGVAKLGEEERPAVGEPGVAVERADAHEQAAASA